jgi:hypothetical protein
MSTHLHLRQVLAEAQEFLADLRTSGGNGKQKKVSAHRERNDTGAAAMHLSYMTNLVRQFAGVAQHEGIHLALGNVLGQLLQHGQHEHGGLSHTGLHKKETEKEWTTSMSNDAMGSVCLAILSCACVTDLSLANDVHSERRLRDAFLLHCGSSTTDEGDGDTEGAHTSNKETHS